MMTEESRDHPSPEEVARRLAWFNDYSARVDQRPPSLLLRCPCCRCKTLGERSVYEICPVCFWEDDGQDDQNADEVWGGPNGPLSLTEARANYRAFGASSERRRQFVRAPQPEELPTTAELTKASYLAAESFFFVLGLGLALLVYC
jgi:hypothetical protein